MKPSQLLSLILAVSAFVGLAVVYLKLPAK